MFGYTKSVLHFSRWASTGLSRLLEDANDDLTQTVPNRTL